MFAVRLLLFVSLVSLSLSSAMAKSVMDLSDMDDEIYRQPWQSYQKILAFEPQIQYMDANEYLWWLLRKAQAENLLTYFDLFSETTKQASALIQQNTPVVIKSQILVFGGMNARRNSEYKVSEELLLQALVLAEEENLNHIYVMAKQELAFTHSLNEQFETSLHDLQEAYVEAYALNDHFLIAVINETYGAIYGYMHDYEKSVDYYTKALTTYEKLEYKAHIAEAIYGIAATYRYWEKYALAIEYFDFYEKKITFTPNTQASFYSAYGKGMTFAEKGDCEAALPVIEKAVSLGGIADYVAELYKRETSCYIQLAQLDNAQNSLDKTKKQFASLPEIDGTQWQLEVDKLEGELAFARGNYQQAYILLNQYYQHLVSLLKKNSSTRLINMRAMLGLERHNIEMSLLQQKSHVQALKIAQQERENTTQWIYIAFGIVFIIVVVVAFIIQHKNSQKILALSITDDLSGLYNRRYIFEHLERLIARCSSNKSSLSVLLIDIDNFKYVNDTYGHPFGDTVIKEISDIGLNVLRSEDVIGRIGGEEFFCILPRIDREQSQTVANRLLARFSEHQFIAGNRQVKVTASIGIAVMEEGLLDGAQLYTQADTALYEAKRLGKNRCSVYKSLTS